MGKHVKIVGIGLVVIAILAFGVTMALAQEPVDPEMVTESETTDTPSGWFGYRSGGRMGREGAGILDTLSDAIGTTVEELQEELSDGASVADVAESHGLELDALVDALMANIRDMLTERLNTPWTAPEGMTPDGEHGMMAPRGGFRMPGGSRIGELAEQLGMTTQEVMTELQTGVSVADLAAEHGLELVDLKAVLVTQHEAILNQAVEAGRITEEKAAEMLGGYEETLDTWLNEPWTSQMPGDCGDLEHPGFRSMPGGRPMGRGGSMQSVPDLSSGTSP